MIDAYRQVTKEIPEVQLALVGSMATDDPEGWEFFQRTFEYADSDPDIKILNNLNNVGAIEVNAFQSQSDVVLQKSIREGFGLTVAEALWKGRPTIGGNVGGIPLQIVDGEDGYLVDSPEEAAKRSHRDPAGPRAGRRLGRAGKEHTREHFLTPRLLRDWLRIFTDLDRSEASPPAGLIAAGVSLIDRERPLTIVSNRGPASSSTTTRASDRPARRRRPGDGAVRAGLAPQRALDRLGDDRGGRRGRRARATARLSVELDGISYDVQLVASDPAAYDRFYNVIANPILWFIQHYLWDLSNAPDIRAGGAWTPGSRATRSSTSDIADA